jgi:hypothetical protein
MYRISDIRDISADVSLVSNPSRSLGEYLAGEPRRSRGKVLAASVVG